MGSSQPSVGGEPGITDPKFKMKSSKATTTIDHASSTFDEVDKDLEKAQALCESAAHQFLRDGDCGEEIQGTRKSFQGCLEMAKKEVESLSKDKENETIERGEEETDNRVKINEAVSCDRLRTLEPKITKPSQFAAAGPIEVDDNSDTESVHIDLSAIRRAARRV